MVPSPKRINEKTTIFEDLRAEGMDRDIAMRVLSVAVVLSESGSQTSRHLANLVERKYRDRFDALDVQDSLRIMEHYRYVGFDASQGKYYLTKVGKDKF